MTGLSLLVTAFSSWVSDLQKKKKGADRCPHIHTKSDRKFKPNTECVERKSTTFQSITTLIPVKNSIDAASPKDHFILSQCPCFVS